MQIYSGFPNSLILESDILDQRSSKDNTFPRHWCCDSLNVPYIWGVCVGKVFLQEMIFIIC